MSNITERQIRQENVMIKAWISKKRRIISFHWIEDAEEYEANEKIFWDYIYGLAKTGYRLQ